MNSVRQALLHRHRNATPRLDALRAETLAQLTPPPRTSPSSSHRPRRWAQAWHELFLVPRHAWGTLGALAMLALTLNLATAPRPPESPRSITPDRAALAEVARERQQLLAELSGGNPGPSPAHPTAPPPANLPAQPPRRSSLDHDSWMV